MKAGDLRFRIETAIALLIPAAIVTCAWYKWLPLDLIEAFGFATGAICVWLLTFGSHWNWPVGLLNNIFFAILFWKARLFADFGIQGIYFALGIWGWWKWKNGGANHVPLSVTKTRKYEWIGIAFFLTAGTWGLQEILIATNGAAPLWDAIATTLSLSAQYLLCQKRIENWFLWISADMIHIPLYASRDLPLTAILYSSFIGLSIIGLKRWKRELA